MYRPSDHARGVLPDRADEDVYPAGHWRDDDGPLLPDTLWGLLKALAWFTFGGALSWWLR